MFKFTVKFKGPSESELKQLFQKAAQTELKKKGFSKIQVSTAKKSGKYDLIMTGENMKAFEKLAKEVNARFDKIKPKK